MEDPRNKNATSVEDPKQWLGQRLQTEKAIRRQFINVEATRAALARGGGVVWVEGRVQAYGQAMKVARQELAPLVHMVPGGPPRGSELVTVKYKNSANGDSRGAGIEDGAVRFTTSYHKNIGQTGKAKVIHRYLPREVGELVVYYLWFASPFWHQINGAVHGKAEEVSAYIWEPRPEKSWQKPTRKRQRNKESSQSSKRAKKDSRVQSNSQAASPEVWDESADDDELVADPQCGVEMWNANRLKYAIQKKSLQHMGVKLNIMGWRHMFTAIYRRYAFLDADSADSDSEDQAFDIQTGHSSSVAASIYGRLITEPMFSDEAKRISLRVVRPRNHSHCLLGGSPIASMNCCSSRGRNVAVKYTICVSARTKFFNANNRLRNSFNESNTTWHSSITIRSSRPMARCRLMYCPNASPTAASGVTNMTCAHSCGR
jgi:hypothetical protein